MKMKRMKSLVSLLLVTLIAVSNVTFASGANDFPTEEELSRMNEKSRRALLEYIADRQAQKASENPEAYNRNVKDITIMERAGAMTGEMAKFYMAVAFLEFSNCLTTGDSTKCTQFMESMKDPIGHIGFAIFMKANKMTIDMAQLISRGKINPGFVSYMGLAGGMMAQTVFQDLYYHPLTQELLKNAGERDPELRRENRKIILNKMWKTITAEGGNYLIAKIPHVAGLLGAAYLSHKTMQLMGYGAGKVGKVMGSFKTNSTTGKVLVEISEDMKKTKSLRASSSRVAFKWVDHLTTAKKFSKASRILRLNPVVALASYTVETVVFLLWAPVVEDFLVKQWDRNKVKSELRSAKEDLKEVENVCYTDEVVEKKAKRVSRAMDKWRETIMHKANNTKMRHLMEINKIDMKYQKLAMYYAWLVEGADRDSEYYKANELSWHKDFIVHQVNEATDYTEEFFCGDHANDIVERYVSYLGIPVPGAKSFDYNYDENRTMWENIQANENSSKPTGIKLGKPRVMRLAGLCEFEMRTVDGGIVNPITHGNYEDVICPLDYDMTNKRINYRKIKIPKLHCQLEQSWARSHVLRTKRFNGQDIEKELYAAYDQTFGKIMAKVWGQRDLMIMNFEKAVRVELIKGLTGKSVYINDSDRAVVTGNHSYSGEHPEGFLPHLYFELGMWQEMKINAESSSEKYVYQKMATQTFAKIKTANQVLNFIRTPYKDRVRDIDTDMFEEVQPGEWQKVVRTLREYVVN